jgi:hypothetical protein
VIAAEVTRQEIAAELPVLAARARRAGWGVQWDDDSLMLRVRLIHERTGQTFELVGTFESYKAIPPAWEFVDPSSGEVGTPTAYPHPPTAAPGRGSPLFIPSGRRGRLICLPCNRLAYGDRGGPHNNWLPTNWMSISPQYLTMCEMVSRINTELQASSGPWAPRSEGRS